MTSLFELEGIADRLRPLLLNHNRWVHMKRALLRWRVTEQMINRPQQRKRGGVGWRPWSAPQDSRDIWASLSPEEISTAWNAHCPLINTSYKIPARSPREPLLPMVWKIAMRDPSGDSFHWPVLPLRTRPLGGSLGCPCPRRRGVLIEHSLPLSSYLRVMLVFISR